MSLTILSKSQVKIDTKIQESQKQLTPFLNSDLSNSLGQGQQPNQLNQGKWTDQENIKFVIFITHNRQIFKSKEKRKAEKIFKNLSVFIQSRNSRQCRSHFQKAIKKFSTIVKMRNYYRNLIGQKQFDKKMSEEKEKIQIINQQIKSKEVKNPKLVSTEVQTQPVVICQNGLIQQINAWAFYAKNPMYWSFPSF